MEHLKNTLTQKKKKKEKNLSKITEKRIETSNFQLKNENDKIKQIKFKNVVC